MNDFGPLRVVSMVPKNRTLEKEALPLSMNLLILMNYSINKLL